MLDFGPEDEEEYYEIPGPFTDLDDREISEYDEERGSSEWDYDSGFDEYDDTECDLIRENDWRD